MEQCPNCGVFMRRTIEPDGSEGWLCLTCPDDAVLDAVTAAREALGLDPRSETCAFAFGLADALAGSQAASGRSPSVVAAACLYLGSRLADDKYGQEEVADAAGTSASALRRSTDGTILYRELYDATDYPTTFPLKADPHPVIDLDGWRAHLEETSKDTSVKTAVSDVRRFAVWYDGTGDPTPAAVARWLAHQARRGFAAPTIERRYESVQQYFAWAGLGDLRERRPAES